MCKLINNLKIGHRARKGVPLKPNSSYTGKQNTACGKLLCDSQCFYIKKNLIANLIVLGDFRQNSEFSASLQKSESCRARSANFRGDISGGGWQLCSYRVHVCVCAHAGQLPALR